MIVLIMLLMTILRFPLCYLIVQINTILVLKVSYVNKLCK